MNLLELLGTDPDHHVLHKLLQVQHKLGLKLLKGGHEIRLKLPSSGLVSLTLLLPNCAFLSLLLLPAATGVGGAVVRKHTSIG